VVKADGLAAGKGVILCDDAGKAIEAATSMLEGRSFGSAGSRIVVEEMLRGREASFFVLADGSRFVELGDAGLNTGGMGTYSPSAYLDDALRETIVESIVRPSIRGLEDDGCPYRGVLYVGLMLTDDGPKVLEYNARFGDPETQVLMPRLDGDWLELLHACARGELGDRSPAWVEAAAVCVVMAAEGYPGSYEKNQPIRGIDDAEKLDGVVVFHAGTKTAGDTIVTAGGRILGVTALGGDLAAARERAYEAVERIQWNGEQHRTDIALDAVNRLAQGATR